MSQAITLETSTKEGKRCLATFDPKQGMTLTNFSIDGKDLFGLSLVGPHFGQRHLSALPDAVGGKDPLFHGIARYAPWTVEMKENGFEAILTGKDSWKEHTLAEWEGQNFTMRYRVSLEKGRLQASLSVVSEFDSIVGLECRPCLSGQKNMLETTTQDRIYSDAISCNWPSDWERSDQGKVTLPLDRTYNAAFLPYPELLGSKLSLQLGDQQLSLSYRSPSQENSWYLYGKKEENTISLIPLSAQNPWRPNLSVSSVEVELTELK